MIIRNRDQKKLSKIINCFQVYRREKDGIIEGTVFSRKKLKNDIIRQLKKDLAQRRELVAEKIDLKNEERSDLKGGLLIYAGGEIIDASLAGRLHRLAEVLRK
jgi:F0F1-type ATP synthase delta subunit